MFKWNTDSRPIPVSDTANAYDLLMAELKATGAKPTPGLLLAKLQASSADRELLPTEVQLKRLATQDPDTIALKDRIRAIAHRSEPVLITGPTGTGKELIARALHGPRDEQGYPFVAENCGGIPESLAPSVFFGYKKGAFTGAIDNQDGKLLAAGMGTIFLDEIGAMPMSLQALLLRAIQENEIYPVGDTIPRRISCRFVAATSRDLDKLVSDGRFLLDLYFRLNTFRIRLKPFAERPGDIDVIAASLGYKEPIDPDYYPQVFLGGVRAIQSYIARMQCYGSWKE